MAAKTIGEVELEDLCKAGGSSVSIEEATHIYQVTREAIAIAVDPRWVWKEVVERRMLKPWHSRRLHQLVYYSIYANWDASINGPPLYWFPSMHPIKDDSSCALVWREEDRDDLDVNRLTLKELREQVTYDGSSISVTVCSQMLSCSCGLLYFSALH